MINYIILLISLLFTSAQADSPNGSEILKRVDENLTYKTSVFSSKMVIHSRRDTRTIESKSWTEGEVKSFSEYLAPAREKGTKMLKIEDQLWMYSPDTDRIIQISGHMLRQSVMGSDLSYDDMMEDPRLSAIYDATVTSTDTVRERPCWILKLTASKEDVAFHTRTMWVDRERFVPLKEEMYAKSGKLLKRVELMDFRQVDKRWYPFRMTYKDVLKTGKGTEFIIESIEFNIPIPEHYFSKSSLRR